MQGKLAALQQTNDRNQKRIDQLAKDKSQQTEMVKNLGNQIKDLNDLTKDYRHEIDALRKEVKEKEKEIKSLTK